MKNIIIALILLFFIKASAQNTELFNNTWYLKKLVISSEEFESSAINGYPKVNFLQNPYRLYISNPECSDFAYYFVGYDGPDNFDNLGPGAGFSGSCVGGWPQYEFSMKHHSIYYQTNSPYTYTLTSEEEEWSLVITNAIGDMAFYENLTLHTNSVQKNFLSIYPNPTRDILYLRSIDESVIAHIKLLESSGKIISTDGRIDWSNYTLDLSDLSSGIYYLKTISKDGAFSIQKIMKL